MKVTPEKYFRMLRTFTLRRPSDVLIFQLCERHFTQYGSCPTREELGISIEQLDGISEEDFRGIGEAFDSLTGNKGPKILGIF